MAWQLEQVRPVGSISPTTSGSGYTWATSANGVVLISFELAALSSLEIVIGPEENGASTNVYYVSQTSSSFSFNTSTGAGSTTQATGSPGTGYKSIFIDNSSTAVRYVGIWIRANATNGAIGSVDYYYACHTYNQWYVLNTENITVLNSTGTIMIDLTGMSLCFKREVRKIAATIPAQCAATFYSNDINVINNSNVDVYGYLASSNVDIITSSGLPNSYLFSDDNSLGNSQWQITYVNTTNSAVTVYLYSKMTGTSNVHRFSTLLYYGLPANNITNLWSLGTTYTLSNFSTSYLTRSVAVSAAANKVNRITTTIPANSIVTYHSESTAGNDPIGFLNPSSAAAIDGATGNPVSYTYTSDNNASLSNVYDWQITYDNSANSSAVTAYLYHRATAANTAISSTIYGVCRYIATSWSLGTTYTMPSLASTGFSTSSVAVSCLSGKVARITISIPAYSTVTLYSESVNNTDVYGYATNSAVAINSSTGAPNTSTAIMAQDDDSGYSSRQWLFKLINNSSSAVTRYIYHRCYSLPNECSSTIYAVSTAGNGWTYSYKGRGESLTFPNANHVETTTFDLTTNANEVGIVYYRLPPYSSITVYPTTTSNIDTVGYLYVNTALASYLAVYSYGGAPVNYNLVDDNSAGNNLWQLSYTNTSPTNYIYLFVYTRAKAVNTATTLTLNATITTTVPNWTLGNTYSYTLSSQSTGTVIQYNGITINRNTLSRIALNVPAHTSIKFSSDLLSQDFSDRPYIIGYVANSTSSIDPTTGVPATVGLTVSYNTINHLIYFLYTNTNSAATTCYVYMRNYYHGRLDSGAFTIEYWPNGTTLPAQLSASHVKIYNNATSSWLDAVPKLYNSATSSWIDATDTIYSGGSWI